MCFVLMILEQFQYESAGVFKHNVNISNTDKIRFQLDCICIVADKVVQWWTYVTYSYVIPCACLMYFDASRDALNV